MLFTLLIATLDRPDILKDCLAHVLSQTFSDFEVIIVDQSGDQLSSEGIESMDPRIHYYRISERGLSHARNYGLCYAQGEYICLVDDDGFYEANVLEVASAIISESHPCILGGRLMDPHTGRVRSNGSSRRIRWKDVFKYLVSHGMIIEKEFLLSHCFDEQFGVGAKYGCGEETDLVLAALKENRLVLFTDQYTVYHHLENPNDITDARISEYSYGYGALCNKARHEYSFFWGSYFYAKTLLGNAFIGIYEMTKRANYRRRLTRIRMSYKGYHEYK